MLLIKEYVLNFEDKQHNISLPTFKLTASTKTRLRRTYYNLFLLISVYDY